MPEQRETPYREWFNDTDSVFVWFATERGVVRRFVVQYETLIDGNQHGVMRYDTAHDFAHRDILINLPKVV